MCTHIENDQKEQKGKKMSRLYLWDSGNEAVCVRDAGGATVSPVPSQHE